MFFLLKLSLTTLVYQRIFFAVLFIDLLYTNTRVRVPQSRNYELFIEK